MTERQLQEQKEAKKLKVMTTCFTAVLALILVVAIVFSVAQFITNSGIREKNTVAAVIGDTELSNAQLNYYYVDAVNEFLRTYGSYAAMFGLDLTKPLDEQVINEETGDTWADDFTNTALQNAKSTYALVNAAKAAGFELTEAEKASLDSSISQMELSALMAGYTKAEDYVKAYYGHGASMDSFREYMEMSLLAQTFYSKYATELTYDEAALRAAEEGKEAEFSNFSYNYYYLNTSKFLTGGTTGEDGTTTYSEEEKAAAVKAAEEAAKALAQMEITSVEEFDAAIAAMTINAGAETAPKSTECLDYAYGNVTSAAREWITDAKRVEGELGYVENASTTTAEDGTESKTINGYYVIYFIGSENNKFPLANVRHILVTEGGKYDSTTGQTTYTDEELAAAKEKAEKILAMYEAGVHDEEAFKALAMEHNTDPGSKENGGLYEDVYPGQMVEAFNDWCFEEGRKPGDTGVVVTPYGAHVMFYVSDSETIYRDMLIENTLRSEDTSSWYEALVEATTVTENNTKYLSRDLVLSRPSAQ
jgi:parvulin-like peptidyl-prolyl isomerase